MIRWGASQPVTRDAASHQFLQYLAALERDLSGLRAQVNVLQTTVTALQGAVATLEATVAAQQTQINTLQSDLSALTGTVTTQGTALSAVTGRMAGIAAVAAPTGGTTIDAESRTAINNIRAAAA